MGFFVVRKKVGGRNRYRTSSTPEEESLTLIKYFMIKIGAKQIKKSKLRHRFANITDFFVSPFFLKKRFLSVLDLSVVL